MANHIHIHLNDKIQKQPTKDTRLLLTNGRAEQWGSKSAQEICNEMNSRSSGKIYEVRQGNRIYHKGHNRLIGEVEGTRDGEGDRLSRLRRLKSKLDDYTSKQKSGGYDKNDPQYKDLDRKIRMLKQEITDVENGKD
jgi:hypothetical protein